MLKRLGLIGILTMMILFGSAFAHSNDSSVNGIDRLEAFSIEQIIPLKHEQIDWDSIYSMIYNHWEHWKNNYIFQEEKIEEEQMNDHFIDDDLLEEKNNEENTPSEDQNSFNEDSETREEIIEDKENPTQLEQQAQEQNITNTPEQDWDQDENQIEEIHPFEEQVIKLTNIERENHGLQPLNFDQALSEVARDKSTDLKENNYFDHHSPIYGSPFDMMQAYGISYQTAGENIAKGQQTPEEVVQAWMNSPGHRANILNSNFTHIGIGYIEHGNYWTQMFIGK